ncbi:hypothetical protein CJE0203 [Campylobacter jejuni RM1221]|nr:hypothetical protein CJE0203 [Campylobacter jejuni RM1221]
MVFLTIFLLQLLIQSYFQEYLDFASNKGKFQVGQIGF